MKAAEEEASSESLSNMQPAIALSCQHRRLPVEACSPCISTEPAASKFDERSRGRFSDVADAGYRTPLPIGRSSDAAGCQPQPISAELLLTAQKKLREVYEPNMLAQSMMPSSLFAVQAAHGAPLPYSTYSAPFEPQMLSPHVQEAEPTATWTNGTCLPHQTGSFYASGMHAMSTPQTTAAGLDTASPTRAQPRPEGRAMRLKGGRRAAAEQSDDDTLSSSSSSKKRKRNEALSSRMQQDSRAAAELALQRQQLQARMEQLAGYNAHLIRQLSAALRTLRSERAASQAEIARLHQKCSALAAFVPPSVAAFALDNPPEIVLNSRAALLRTHSSP
ncbi:g4472 [Coccomyxa elongata]